MKKFCCCFDLRTGVICISIFYIIITILLTGVWIWGLASPLKNHDDSSSDYSDLMTAEETYQAKINSIGTSILSFTTSFVTLGFMLYGGIKERREFILPWLCVVGVSLTYATILFIILAIYTHSAFFVGAIIGTAVGWYSWEVVLWYWIYAGSQARAAAAMITPSSTAQFAYCEMGQNEPLTPGPAAYPVQQYPVYPPLSQDRFKF